MKRIISLILVFMMVITTNIQPVFADEEILDLKSDEEAVEADYDWLQGDMVIYPGGFANDIRSDVKLPTEGQNGSSIIWTSSDERWIATNGTVIQPPFSFAMGNALVTLTATISSGAVSMEKTFELEVVAQYPTSEDNVAIDKSWLTYEIILNGNSSDNVKTKLNIPIKTERRWSQSGYYGGCDIEWQSSNSGVIKNDGSVIRPEVNEGNQSVTLTATISYGEIYDTKTFDFVVTAVEEFPLAINYYDFSDASHLKFNNVCEIFETTDRDNNPIKVLRFNNDRGADKTTGGSIFTKNKIRLGDNLSFSTAFSYSNPHPNYTKGEGGFIFTLQTISDSVYPQSFNDESIKPSLNIAFVTDYYSSPGSGQATNYGYREMAVVYYNGDYENRTAQILTSGYTNDSPTNNNVWIEYDGLSKVLEVRFSTDCLRPVNSNLKIENLELDQTLTSSGEGLDIEDVREVYVGFMGSLGNAKDKSEIKSLYFKNDSTPIDFNPYNFIDLSNVVLSADPSAGQASSIISARVCSLDGIPVANTPVSFSTSFGALDSSSAITDDLGYASILLYSGISGNAQVKAYVPGGATALTEVQLVANDDDKLNFDSAWLTEERILGDNSILSNITYNLNLPLNAPNGSTINWESNKTSVVDTNGLVTRPFIAQGNQVVTLIATISTLDKSTQKTFHVTVKVRDDDLLAADKEWLTNGVILDENESLDKVISNLKLPTTGENGSIISWISDKAGAITENGIVKRPYYTQGNQSVTLTATITMGGFTLEKTFNITVIALVATDEETSQADLLWLTDGIILNENESLYEILSNLNLPVVGLYGSEISWESTNEDFATVDGIINRPTYSQNYQNIALTATISKGSSEYSKIFNIRVAPLATDAEALSLDEKWLTYSIINGENAADYTTVNLNLPVLGIYGSSISWSSNNNNVIKPDGTVIRPTFTQGNKGVTLTAHITKGSGIVEKSFIFNVKKYEQTDMESVTADKRWLQASQTLGENLSQYSINQNLSLPTSAPNGSSITWVSDMPSVISSNGEVTIPEYREGNKNVILTVTFEKGTIVDSNTYKYSVLSKPDIFPPEVIGTTPINYSANVLWNTREITITFDENIKVGAPVNDIENYGITLNGLETPSISVSIFKNELKVNLIDYFKSGAEYELVVPSNTIVDNSNNYLNKEIRISFGVEQKLNSKIEVVESLPNDKEKQVSCEIEQISFKFNYSNIIKGSGFEDISLIDINGNKLNATKSIVGDTVTLTIDSDKNLLPGSVYEVSIPEDAVTDRFENRSIKKLIKFRTESSNILPLVKSCYPYNGQTGVDVNQKVRITFTEAMNTDDCKLILLDDKGNEIKLFITTLTDARNVIFLQGYSLRGLKPNTVYTVKGPYNIEGSSDVGFEMFFTTGSDSLNVTNRNILSGGNLPINTPIEIAFSAPISEGANFTNIKVLDSKNNELDFIKSIVSNKVVLAPNSPLNPSETYEFYIPKGAVKNQTNIENDDIMFWRTAAERLNYGNYSFYMTSTWVTQKVLSFNARWLGQISRPLKSITWDFGDGKQASNDLFPVTVYWKAGNYKVTLTLVDDMDISYKFEQMITINGLNLNDLQMSVYNDNSCLTVYEENNLYGIKNIEPFSITLYSPSIGYVSDETVKVSLYKNGAFVEDLGNVKTRYNGEAQFLFNYGNKGYFGTYEVVFEHNGTKKQNVRKPVFFSEATTKQSMVVQLYNKEVGGFIKDAQDMYFDVNGEKKLAKYEKFDNWSEGCYIIKGLETGATYSLKLSGSGDVSYVSDEESIYHQGSDNSVYLTVETKHPGLNYIKSALTDSRPGNRYKGLFINNISIPNLSFELNGDWDGLNPGYYELKSSLGSVSLKSDKPVIELQPGLQMKAGEELWGRMVSKSGAATLWQNTNVTVAPYPSLGYGPKLNISYVNGEYIVDSPVSLSSLTGGKLDILDGIPLLDSAQSFGIGSSTNRFNGSISKNGFLDLKYEYGSGHGLSTKKSKMLTTGYDVEADISFYGRLYYDRYGSNEWKLSYYVYYLTGRGQYYWKKSYNIPKLDIGGWGKLTMGSNIDGKLVIEGKDNDSNDFKGILEFDPYVSASIGAGVEGVLSVEGYVTGNVPAEFHIPTGYIQVEPNIQAGIVVYYIFDSKTLYSKEIARTHWDNGKEKVELFSRQFIEEFEEEDIEFTPTPRNYLERGSQWLVGNNIKRKSVMTSYDNGTILGLDLSSNIETMTENIYPRSEVQLTSNGNEKWLVWTDDNSIRDANNRTQLKYSVYRDGSWIEPEWFGDDETADFAPTTATMGNGMLLAWQNIKNVMVEETKNESFLKDSEISVTNSIYKSDGSVPDIITLTDDDKFDHSPVIAADNGKAILVWTKSEGLGLTLGEDLEELHSSANSDCIYSSVWDGSTWSTPEKIEGSMPTIVDSSLTMHGEEAILLYTLDLDNDQFTQEDREIYYRIYDGITWSNANCLTNNNTEDLSPKAVNINGEWFIIWKQDGNIMYKAGLSEETKTDEFLSSVPNNYEMIVVEGDYPQLTLVYTSSNSNNATSLSASFYDVNKGIWSDVITLNENTGYIRSFSPTFTKDGELNVVYTQAELIRKAVGETEFLLPSDKVDLMMLSYTPKHDLALAENSLELMPSIPVKGTLSTVSTVVKNLGDFAEYATLELYEGTPSEGKLIGEITTSEPIAAHSIAQLEVEWLVGVEDKNEFELYVVVRPLVGIHDTNEDNNILSLKIATADVAVTDLECENIQGDNYITKTRIANVGGKMLEDIKVELVHETSGQILETKSIDQIMPGQKIDLNFLFSSQDLTKDDDGKINMHIRATLTHFEEEYSTENNTCKFALEPASIKVDGINPLPNETKINIVTPLIIRFNMNVEPGLEFGEIEMIDDDLNEIDINKTLDGSTLTIIPQSPLSYGTGYTLILPDEAVSDSYGHTMNESYNLSFVTTLSSPEIIFAYPGKGMTDIELDSEIKVKFNQAVMKGLTFENIAMYTPNSKKVPLTASIYGEWLYINLAGNLSPSTVYSLVIPEGALQSSNGEILFDDYILDFTTNANDNSNTSDSDDTHHKNKVSKDEISDEIIDFTQQVSFNDVDEDAWYYKAVSFIAARSITKGTGNGNYSPDAKLTRSDFLVLMMRAYGIEADSNSTDNFVDGGNTYYTNYLATAKRLGISEGVGNNMFDPEREITRQEMFTLLYNVLKSIDRLPKGISGKTLSDFTDVDLVASWANNELTILVETGTIAGDAGKLSPTSTTTRAEMAQVLYNLLSN